MPHGKAASEAFAEAAEMLTNARRSVRVPEAGGTSGGKDPDALGRAVIDGDEHRGLALAGDRGREHQCPT